MDGHYLTQVSYPNMVKKTFDVTEKMYVFKGFASPLNDIGGVASSFQ